MLKKVRPQGDVTLFARLQEIFGCNARTISECREVKKYRYTKPTAGKSEGTKEVVKRQKTQYMGRQKAEGEPGPSTDAPTQE